ncbi:uncharacterized protein LOC108712257 [Xenopus laevis]|uniref:Uncharacterized protein LOC108712257 n=1 Tax=Xenopus laevis TaxID=8355 RepID=A0A8J1MT61_XENLA|nr:uncharacterized protein LOC108712257 [Xenopus laevis]
MFHFNTTENLYKKYVFLDPLAGVVTGTNPALEGEDEDELFDAPLSITKREQQTAENYFYVPDLGQVPEIDVPYSLPDLLGVADDLMYSADLGPESETSAYNPVTEPSTLDIQTTTPDQWPLTGKIVLAVDLLVAVAAFILLFHGAWQQIKIQTEERERQEKLKSTTINLDSPHEKHTVIYVPGLVDLPKTANTEIIAEAVKAGEKIPQSDEKENNPSPVNIEVSHEQITEPQVTEPKEGLQEKDAVDTKKEKKKKRRLFSFSKKKVKEANEKQKNAEKNPSPDVKANDVEIDIEKGKVEEVEEKKKLWRFFAFLKKKAKEENETEKLDV